MLVVCVHVEWMISIIIIPFCQTLFQRWMNVDRQAPLLSSNDSSIRNRFHATMCTTLLGTFQVLQVIKAPIHSTWGSSFIHGSRYHPNDFHRVLSTCYTLFEKIKGKKVNIGTTSVVNMNPMVPFTIH